MISQNRSSNSILQSKHSVLPTILIIDDILTNLFVFQALIENNLKTEELLMTTDPAEGFNLALIHLPDAILLDYQMPEMNGIELCRRIKANKLLTDIPVLLITGSLITPELKAESLDAGALDFFEKPLNMTELIDKLEMVLKSSRHKGNLKITDKQS